MMARGMARSSIRIRIGRPEDAAAVAPLIRASGPRFHDHIFAPSGDPAQALSFIETAWRTPGTPQSARRGRVATIDGAIAGVLLVYDTAATTRLMRALTLAIARTYGEAWEDILRRGMEVEELVAGVPDDGSFYVSTLAVKEGHRRRGLGRLLLQRAIDEAERRGRAILLHVATHNEPARRLYESAGFRVVRECRDREVEQRLGFDGQLLMRRDAFQPDPPDGSRW